MIPLDNKQNKRAQRICIELILISLGLLYAATIWTWHIGMQANNLDHALYHVTANLEGIRKNVALMEAQQR